MDDMNLKYLLPDKDSIVNTAPIIAYEHPIGSLEKSSERKGFLDEGEILVRAPAVALHPINLNSVCANNSFSFPDIDGSLAETFSNYEDNDVTLPTLTPYSNDNRGQNGRPKNQHFKHLASLDDI